VLNSSANSSFLLFYCDILIFYLDILFYLEYRSDIPANGCDTRNIYKKQYCSLGKLVWLKSFFPR